MNGSSSPLLLGAGLCCAAWTCTQAQPLTPAAELATFRFADSNLVASLVAAEPDVISPVAIAWDAANRLFVAEMRDYPNATNGGTIRLLEDRNGDGRYEHVALFAEHLQFPNSILPWNGGVLVTAAPDLLFLKDTDGDGRADERRVLFTGFGTGNQQLRANGLYWGLDNWVYGANGRSDGQVAGQSLRGRDFRFRPDTGEFETLAGRSQFGLARDDWGNRFLSWNTIPVRHEVFPDRYLARNPKLPALEGVVDCLPAGDTGEVHPLTPVPLIFNNESSSHFNALAGLTVFRGDALGSKYRGNAFVGESLRNLVHRRLLVPDGPTFVARRPLPRTEFLASTDPWFHPVNFATGPDGALYIVDFYRRFVEHPDFVPQEMRDQFPWNAGSERGRLWRVHRRDQPGKAGKAGKPLPKLANATAKELVRHLESANAWQRDTAERLLVQRQDTTEEKTLRRLAQSDPRPETRVQTWHTLASLRLLDERSLSAGLRDPHPRVREQVILLVEEFLANKAQALGPPPAARPQLESDLVRLTNDTDDRVLLRLALALGGVENAELREPALASLLAKSTNSWLRLAALSSSRVVSNEEISRLLPQPAPLRPPPKPAAADPDCQRVIDRFAPALQLPGERSRGAAAFAKLCLACHYLQGHGRRVGPDLSGLAARPIDALLVDLIDPSRQIAADYAVYEVVTASGEVVSGLIASETATRIVLRHAGAPDETIPRDQMRELRPTGKSLMPDGLEAGLSEQDMADLLAFLRAPDGSLLKTE